MGRVRGGGIEQKGKRTHGHEQQRGDYVCGDSIKALNGNGKNTIKKLPWLLWLSGLNASLWTKGLLVWFIVRAHVWVVGQVSSWGCVSGNHTLMLLSLFFSLPFSINKEIKSFKKNFKNTIPYDFTYTWNLKNNINEQTNRQIHR